MSPSELRSRLHLRLFPDSPSNLSSLQSVMRSQSQFSVQRVVGRNARRQTSITVQKWTCGWDLVGWEKDNVAYCAWAIPYSTVTRCYLLATCGIMIISCSPIHTVALWTGGGPSPLWKCRRYRRSVPEVCQLPVVVDLWMILMIPLSRQSMWRYLKLIEDAAVESLDQISLTCGQSIQ